MNPPAICRNCKRAAEFHEDEMELAARGLGLCIECSLEYSLLEHIGQIQQGEVEAPEWSGSGIPEHFEEE